MIYGIVKRHSKITTHHESAIRRLAGQKVAMFPETAKVIKGYGLRVDVTPADLSNKSPVSILVRHIVMDDDTANKLNRAVSRKVLS